MFNVTLVIIELLEAAVFAKKVKRYNQLIKVKNLYFPGQWVRLSEHSAVITIVSGNTA